MKPNLLDELFIKQLRNQSKLPSNIQFRKNQIYQSIETKRSKKSNQKWRMSVAILILCLFSSGYWHYEQEKIIREQGDKLIAQENLMIAITNNSKAQKAKEKVLFDSLRTLNNQIKNKPRIARIEPMPAYIINQPIVFKNNDKSDLVIPKQITYDQNTKKQPEKLTDLDLPVVYESENLADINIKDIETSALSKKISKLFNN